MPKTLDIAKPKGLYQRVLLPLLDFCTGPRRPGRTWAMSGLAWHLADGSALDGRFLFASSVQDPGDEAAWYQKMWSLGGGESASGRRRPFKKKAATHAPAPGGSNDIRDIFLYFLSTGLFPEGNTGWTVASLEGAFLDKVRKEHQFFGAPSAGSEFCQLLLQLLLANDMALTRVLVQFEEPILEDIFGHTTDFGMVNRWVGWLTDMPGLDRKKLCWQVTLKSLEETGGKVTLATYTAIERRILQHLLGSLDPGILAVWFDHLPAVHKAKLLSTLEIEDTGAAAVLDILALVKQRRPHHAPFGRLPAGTGVVLENAGLVLVYPYLPDLFGSLGWWDSTGNFRDETMRQRAVLLLEHLVRPGEPYPENALLLNKALCGHPSIQTLPRSADWGETEMAVVDTFFRMILQDFVRFGVLQHATPELFRQTYLRRTGLLTRREHDWHLDLDRRPEDGALKALPWKVHKIRHTWMRRTLYVDWK